jgi:putative transcription factor
MVACGSCARLGRAYWEPNQSSKRVKKVAKLRPIASAKSWKPVPQTLELVENFGFHVRQAREKLLLSHEDLGKKIGEKVSVLRKIESGKMAPSHKLANKLQHALKITLLVPYSEPKLPSASFTRPREATLGEIAYQRGKKPEENEERESS